MVPLKWYRHLEHYLHFVQFGNKRGYQTMNKGKSAHLILALLILLLFPLLAHALPGDLDGSGRVDGYDLIIFGLANGSHPGDSNWNADADLNGDGKVDSADLAILAAQFGYKGISFGLWVGDWTTTPPPETQRRVSKLSSKGNLLKRVGTFTNTVSISGNVTDGTVWIADADANMVKKLAAFDGLTLLTINGMDPYSVSVNSKDGSVWVADYANNRVVKLFSNITDGYTVGAPPGGKHLVVNGFNGPRSVSVNPETGVVWVADTNNNRIVRLSADILDGYNIGSSTGSHIIMTGFSAPYDIAVNVADGTAWVADTSHNQVVKVSSAGTTEILRIGGFNSPVALDVNYIDGSVWIADRYNNRVVRLSSDGAILATATGFNSPLSVAVNPLDGTCWVADYYNSKVVKLSPNGTELLRIGGFTNPQALAVTPEDVSASRAPSATASLSSNNVDPGQIITFTGTGTDPDGTIVRYEWDFNGDGVVEYQSASTGITTHAYSTIGVYNPVFRVTDNDGLTATDYSQIVRVGALKAIAGANVTSGNAPLTVNFTASFIDPIDGFVDNYQWDFDGDGMFEEFLTGSGNKSHQYPKAGVYQATLKIVDGPHVATDSLTIMVLPSPPVATASVSPTFGLSPLGVNLTGSGTDPDGTIVLYEWDFGSGTYDWHSVSGGNTTHIYTSNGTYNAKFRVTDNDGLTNVKTVTVDVGKALPIAVANAFPKEGYPPLLVNFNATGSSDPGGAITLYEWNFGDFAFFDDMEGATTNWTADSPWGVVTTGCYSGTKCWTDSPAGNYASNANTSLTSKTINLSGATSGTLSFWHRYVTESGYDFGRVEISKDGGTTWTQLAYYSGAQATWTKVQIDISSYLPANVKIRFRFTSNASNNYDGWYIDDVAISTPTWTTSADGTATHTYNYYGSYLATLRVTDNDGNKATSTVTINVTPNWMPTATASATPLTGTVPPSMNVTFTGSGVDPNGTITKYEWNFGEEYVWVADGNNNQMVRLIQDGSGEIVRKGGFSLPNSVSVNPNNGTVWIADQNNHQVVRLPADGRVELVRAGGFWYPASVSVNPTDGTVWVADYSNNQVVKLKPDGSEELVRKGGFYHPISVSVNPTDGTVWVADASNNQVVKLGADGTELIRVSGFSYPISVSTNPADGSIWVADYNNNRIVKLLSSVPNGYNVGTQTGSHVSLPGFNRPNSVSVNGSATNGTCWVADTNNHKIVQVKADGSGELLRLGGFYGPLAVAVNSTTGIVWVADTNNNQVVKLDSNGNQLARLSGFNGPRAVAVVDTGAANYPPSSSSTGNTSHAYSVPGIYKAILTVTDNDSNKDTDSVQIRVYGIPSVTAGASTTSGPAPLDVFLFGAVSDLDGTIAKYEWDFDGGGTYDWTSSTTARVEHVYPTSGTYHPKLRVTDMDGYTNTSSLTITVSSTPPTVTAGAAPLKGNASLLVNFFGTATDPDGTITEYRWNFGDGTSEWTSPSTASTTHPYNSNGTFTATLTVKDNDNRTTTSTVQIQVNLAGTPSALMYAEPTQGVTPLTVRFCGSGIDPDGTITLYEWDLDGNGTYELSSATAPTAFGDKMEDGVNGWVADPPWQRVYTDYHSPVYSWTDSPGGNYGNNVDASLISKTISLSGTIAPKLIFWHRYDFKSGDYGRVKVSGDNGSTWTELGNFTNATLSSWTKQEYTLLAYKGNSTVKIRFQITTDASGTGDGWYIDDVWVGDCISYTYAAPPLAPSSQYTAKLRVTDNSAKTAIASENITVLANQNTSFVWVADYNHHQVVKLSDDGRELARIVGFSYPRELKVDQANGGVGDVWVADTGNNRVVKLSANVQNGYDMTKPDKNTPDASLTQDNGVLYGNASIVAGGKLGNALTFDGAGDYVQVPDSPAFRMTSWTMEAWIKATNFSGSTSDRVILGKVSQNKDFAIGLRGDKAVVWTYTPTQTFRKYVTSSSIAAGSWYHVAGIYDAPAGKLRLYVHDQSGTSIYSGEVDAQCDTSNTDPFLIGDSWCCGEYFNGMIDDVRIWNVARSASEISSNLGELTGTEIGLVGYWKLNEIRTSHQFITGFSTPYYVDVDTTDHGVWVTEYISGGQVKKLSSTGTLLKTVTGFSYPRRVSVYQADRSVWVSNENGDQVVKLDSNGNELLRIGGFDAPIGIAVDQADGSVWVASYYQNQVVKLSVTGTVLYRIGGFYNPVTVAVDPNDRGVWVTDFNNDQVVKLTKDGAEILRVGGFDNPYDIDVNPKDGTVWVSDYYKNQVVKLAPDGTELVRLSGFYNPIGISIDAAVRNLTSPPVASLGATPSSGVAPLTVTFTGTGTPGTGTLVRYQLDFEGNGTYNLDSPSSINTTYTYTSPGTYTPVLKVTNSSGLVDYDSKTIYVGPLSVYPTVSPSTGSAPIDITLNGSVRGVASGRWIVKYEWDFEGDGIFDWTGTTATGPRVVHHYATGATYTPTLRVTDNLGTQAYGSTTLLINKTPPTANNTASPTSGPRPLNVSLTGSGSDVDGSIVLYEWDYDGDGVYDWFSTTTPNTLFTYKTAGTYNPTLRVTDNDGLTATASKTITVTDSILPPVVTASSDVTEGNVPLMVNFSGTAVDPDDGQIILYEWDFQGDGVYDWSSPTTASTSYTYNNPGQYRATLRAKDIDSLTSTASVLITVHPAGFPKAKANATPTTGDSPLSVNFSATGSTDPGGTISLYEWVFGEEIAWVADYNNGQVARLESHHETNRLLGFRGPYRVSVNQADGTAWVTDGGNNQVVKLEADGSGEIFRVGGFSNPWGISVNSTDGTAWVSDNYNNQVVKLSPSGTELKRKGGFNRPMGVAINPANGDVWAADYYNSNVVRLASDGTEVARIYGFNNPFWVSVNPRDGSAWVADRYNNRAVKLAADTPNGYDSSASTFKITPNSAASSRPGYLFGDAALTTGKFGNGVSFDGSGDFVQVPDNEIYRMNSWTIEAWMKVSAYSGDRVIAGKVGNCKDFAIGLSGDRITVWTASPAECYRHYVKTSSAFTVGQWYHVAGVYDASTSKLRLYVDGDFKAEITAPSDTTNTDIFRIGGAYYGSEYFAGVIDDVRIWNVARTGDQIHGSKDGELTGTETGLIGYWKLNAVSTTPYHKSLGGFNEPLCTAVNPLDGTAWVCDFVGDAMVKVSEDCTREIIRVRGFYRPHEAFVNPLDGTVWIADHYNSQIVKLTADGREINRQPGYLNPTSVVIYNPPSNHFSSASSGSTTHTYTHPGEYVATLKVTDNSGLTDTDTVSIRAGKLPEALPKAYPTTGTPPLTVQFYSDGKSPQGTLVAYLWDFNGDGVIDNPNFGDYTIPRTFTYTYQYPGTYQASLKVVDNWGWSDTKTITITVNPPDGKPTAEAMANPVEGNAPLLVSFTGLGSDKDGFIKKYEWDFGDGTPHFISTATGKTTHTYSTPGVYVAQLTVTDNDANSGTDTVRIDVKPAGSPLAIAGATPTSGVAALNVVFTGSGVDDGTIVKYEWDFDGNGTYDWSSTTTGNASYSYAVPGVYNATLRVTDNSLLTDTAVVTITVLPGISASLSTDMFDPTSGQIVKINSVLTANATITIRIKDRVGGPVRTLVSNASRTTGYYSDPWDGKNDSAQVVVPGVYLYVIEYTVGGKTYSYDLSNTAATDPYGPGVTYPVNFNPFNSETNFFRYTLDTKSEVTVYISPFGGIYGFTGPRIKTLLLKEPQKAGSYVLVWDGTDDAGNLVPPHTYVIAVFGWRLPANAIIVASEPIISDLLVSPTYLNPGSGAYSMNSQTTFTYTLSKAADVVATLYNEKNYLVKTVTAIGVPAGEGNTITWDGKNKDGKYAASGIYRLTLTATDGNGNKSLPANALVVVFY